MSSFARENVEMGSLPSPAQALPSLDAGCIDFNALVARCLGNTQLVDRVIGKFNVQVDADLAALEQAIDGGDCDAAMQVAHRLKGIAGSVGGKRLFQNASEAEQLALENQLDKLPEYLERMRDDRQQIGEVFAVMRPNLISRR
jgi:HPt (histidine-containing phosphotransfer) domain-containing protein